MTPLATLRAMRRLLARPERWTQGAYARDAHGESCVETNPVAVSWCLNGAREKVAPWRSALVEAPGGVARLLSVAAGVGPDGSVVAWQDKPGRRHATVLRVLDMAIELARKERRR